MKDRFPARLLNSPKPAALWLSNAATGMSGRLGLKA
jgi:hypothetical protein